MMYLVYVGIRQRTLINQRLHALFTPFDCSVVQLLASKCVVCACIQEMDPFVAWRARSSADIEELMLPWD